MAEDIFSASSSSTEQRINVADLQKGIYLVRVFDAQMNIMATHSISKMKLRTRIKHKLEKANPVKIRLFFFRVSCKSTERADFFIRIQCLHYSSFSSF